MIIFSEILGTKDYRKPEWVSHMEEMQEAIQGKNFNNVFFNCSNLRHKFTQKCIKLMLFGTNSVSKIDCNKNMAYFALTILNQNQLT